MIARWTMTALALCACAGAAELSPALASLFDRGNRAYQAGKLELAEHDFLDVIRQGGDLAPVRYNLGTVYQQRNDPARAVDEFRAALRLDPGFAAAPLALGISLLALNRTREATIELERAVKLAPREAQPRLQLAKAYERTGNMLASVDQLREACALAPQEPEPAYQLARAYMNLTAWSLTEITKLDKNSARVFQALGESYREQGQIDLAIGSFVRATSADPRLPDLHAALGVLYLQKGKLAEAQAEIDRELAISPENAGALALKRKIQAMRKP